MRTLLAGLEVLRRSPVAFVPIALEAALAGLLVAMGAFPSDAASAPAAAVFPLGMYFDLKQSLAWGSAWSYVFAAVLLGGLIRSAALAGTLWLADGARGPFLIPWMRVLRLAAIAPLALFPAAVLHFTGHAVRYTPFVVAGALVGVPAALLLARRAVALDAGAGPSAAKSPRLGGFLVYAYLIALSGAGLAVVGRTSVIGAGVFLALLGPLHAIVLLGWRETARRGDPSSAGWATAATIALSLLLAAAALYDRTLARPGRAEDRRGHLMLLGGVDSTSRRGALSKLDASALGFPARRTIVLSYRGNRGPYEAADTRKDLLAVARRVGRQIGTIRPPRLLLGHSQAGLILDRIIVEGAPLPDTAVTLAGPPPFPPSAAIPPPGVASRGAPGASAARAFSGLLETVGVASFDIDSPASPPNLRPILASTSPIPRLAVWPLADSVWLDSDWRRPGEVNVVALTDHVGVTKNSYAYAVADDFLSGREVAGHEVSWQGFLVGALRYAFEPWRP